MCYKLIRPLLFSLDPELAHNLVFSGLGFVQRSSKALKIIKKSCSVSDPRLQTNALGIKFSNPIGLAAGADKNAKLIKIWQALGFGFAEVGSVTAKPLVGNPKPRLFRLVKDAALINRMGLNNLGAAAISQRIEKPADFVVGISIAKTVGTEISGEAAIQDYLTSFRAVHSKAHYVVADISCPNTADGQTFQTNAGITSLISGFKQIDSKVPLLVKFSPDIEEQSFYELLDTCLELKVSGIVLTNTSLKREGLKTPAATIEQTGRGGLSGPPLRAKVLRLIKLAREHTQGKLTIIGVGGVNSAESAYEMLRAGASLIQLYTGLIYEGPGLIRNINRGLIKLLERDGFSSLEELHKLR